MMEQHLLESLHFPLTQVGVGGLGLVGTQQLRDGTKGDEAGRSSASAEHKSKRRATED